MTDVANPAGWDDPILDVEVCSACGAEMVWTDCWECHGEGGFDLYEEDPFYYDAGDTEPCGTCNGSGGYLECAAVDSPAHGRAAVARRA